MRYQEPAPIELAAAERAIASGEPSLIADALLRSSLSPIDGVWVQAVSLQSLASPHSEVRRVALIALGHLVRRYEGFDKDAVLREAMPLLDDPYLAGTVEDLMSDIEVFGPR